MLRRYFIYKGDRTTTGGNVLEGLDNVTWDGRNVAYEGARVFCPACKSAGVIKCVQPFRPYTLPNGRQIALEHDLCVCGCRRPPTLIASQTAVHMDFEGHEAMAVGAADSAPSNEPMTIAVAAEAPTICLDCLAKAAAAGAAMVVRT